MDLAHGRLATDFTFYMFLAEASFASAVIYACATFFVSSFVYFPWRIPQLQSDWSLSCDHELEYYF